MINLIPPEAKSVMKFEYWARVLSVWSFLFAGVGFTAALLLVPTYVLLKTQLEVLNTEFDKTRDDAASFAQIEKDIKDANYIIDQLQKEQQALVSSRIIEGVTAATNEGITLSRFMMSAETAPKKGSTQSIQVQGEAQTREALAAFKTELERSPLFETASVPISDLARDVKLPFVVTITVTDLDL